MYSSTELLLTLEDAIKALPLECEPKGLYEPIRYVLSLGGKRIRPALMLMAGSVLGAVTTLTKTLRPASGPP